MKKIVIIITIILLAIGCFSGCTEQKATENPTDESSDLLENKAPTASCSANPTNGEAPLQVSFTGTGMDTDGTIVSYHWDFDDDASSAEQNPSHTFQTSGTYTITLTVTDDKGETGYDTIQIIVEEPQNRPVAHASADVTIGDSPLEVQFTGSGEVEGSSIVSYHWDFGDGATSNYQNPNHKFYGYLDEGKTYTITLTVTDDKGQTATDTIIITIKGKEEITLNPIADAYVDSAEPYTNFGKDDGLWVYGGKYLEQEKITYLKFDLSGVPSGSTIHSAKLELHSSVSSGFGILCYRSTDISWGESTIDWTNKPSYSGEYVEYDLGWEIDSEYSWEDKNFVQNALSSGKITLVLVDDDSDYSSSIELFESRESSIDYMRPELTIEYS
jgi:PKD repeat protein